MLVGCSFVLSFYYENSINSKHMKYFMPNTRSPKLDQTIIIHTAIPSAADSAFARRRAHDDRDEGSYSEYGE